jgi:DNA-binding CsgD family transcriptional regulator
MLAKTHADVLRRTSSRIVATAANRIHKLARLTDAERAALLWLLVTPHSKDLAQAINKRPNTINNQLASAIAKLAVQTREGLLIFLFTGERPWLGENHYSNRPAKR